MKREKSSGGCPSPVLLRDNANLPRHAIQALKSGRTLSVDPSFPRPARVARFELPFLGTATLADWTSNDDCAKYFSLRCGESFLLLRSKSNNK